jgi:hypothetical protein
MTAQRFSFCPSSRETGRGCLSEAKAGEGNFGRKALSRLTPAAFATLSRKREGTEERAALSALEPQIKLPDQIVVVKLIR